MHICCMFHRKALSKYLAAVLALNLYFLVPRFLQIFICSFFHYVCLVTFGACLFRVVTSLHTHMQTRLSLLLKVPVVGRNFKILKLTV